MSSLESRRQLYVGLFLICLMMATRGHHFASIYHLPDASWAVFFLAGAYLRPSWTFYALCTLAVAIDWAAITWGGVSSFCVTLAYVMLLPAYGSLWLGGRWHARHHRKSSVALLPLIGSVLVSACTAEILSSGSFYFFGGRLATPVFADFLRREIEFFPAMLETMALYVGLAVLVHGVLAVCGPRDGKGRHPLTSGLDQ
jgi:hypothetical protein